MNVSNDDMYYNYGNGYGMFKLINGTKMKLYVRDNILRRE